MSSHSTHPDTTPVIGTVRSLANCQHQQKCGPSGNSQLCPAKWCIAIPAAGSDSSQGGSSVASTIQSQNATTSSSLNYSRIADIIQCMPSTPSTTQWQSINTPTVMPGRGIQSPAAHGRTSWTDSTRHVVSSPASGTASTPTPLSGLETLPIPIPDPEGRAIITNPVRTRATEGIQIQRQWQFRPQLMSTPQSMNSGGRSVCWFGHSDMTCLVFASGWLLELYMWTRRPCMSASDLEMIRYAMRCLAK